MNKLKLFGILFVFGAGIIYAEPLNWQNAFSKALNNNPEIANARNELELSGISYRSSYLNHYPSISGSMSARTSDSGSDSYSYGLSGRLSIFSGFHDSNNIKLKRTNLSIQEATYKQTLSDFVYTLRISFSAVLKNQLTARLLDSISIRRKNNMDLVKLRYDAGREDKGAYLRSEADYLEAKYEIRSLKRKYAIVQRELLKMIGESDYRVISVTGTFDIPSLKNKPSEELLKRNPSYVIAKYRKDYSAYALTNAYGNFYPDISLSGSVSNSGNEWPPTKDSRSAEISLSYPFFSGGRDFYDLKSAELNRRISENDLENTQRELMIRIESAYNDVIDASEFYKVKEKYYSASKERAEISRAKYINGLISYQDWDSIENDFINAQKSLLDAQYSVFISWAKWLKTIGEAE